MNVGRRVMLVTVGLGVMQGLRDQVDLKGLLALRGRLDLRERLDLKGIKETRVKWDLKVRKARRAILVKKVLLVRHL